MWSGYTCTVITRSMSITKTEVSEYCTYFPSVERTHAGTLGLHRGHFSDWSTEQTNNTFTPSSKTFSQVTNDRCSI